MILAYCVVGGLWAVVITDFLQAVILMPFTIVMLVASLAARGRRLRASCAGLPPEVKSLALPGEYGWLYVGCWTVMVSFGYNTAAMAQRYFSVDDERVGEEGRAAVLRAVRAGRASSGSCRPLAMRVLYPDLSAVWPGLANPHEASYAVAALTLLPNGLVGIMLAAMFSATMSSLSGLFNMHAAVVSKDIYQTLFAPAAERAGAAGRGLGGDLRGGRDHDRAGHGHGGQGREHLRGDADLQHRHVARLRPARAAGPRRRSGRRAGRASLTFAVGLALGLLRRVRRRTGAS